MYHSSKNIAFGGVFASLAVVMMCLGGMIPVATFICPILCMILVWIVQKICGTGIAWAWYGAVALLCLLFVSDKEAAAVFLFFGYYPIIKRKLDKLKFSWLFKILLFNVSIWLMYMILIHVLGIDNIADDYRSIGSTMTVVMVIMGNLTFFLLDKLLDRLNKRSMKR